MKILPLLAVLLAVFPAVPATAQTRPVFPSSIQDISAKVRPSLVRIHVVESAAQSGRESRDEAFGSGVLISSDGYILTNHHVAGKARWLSCTLWDKSVVEAKLVGTDPLSDLAVIKIAGGPYQSAPWGDDRNLRVGDPVLAMGSPLAFSQSVTAGIVSNTELVMPETYSDWLSMDGEDVGSIVRWIGHDAAIYGGNSGGPLVNLQGEIVGINEIEMGLSGAIPATLARGVAEELIKNGRVARAFSGLELQPRLQNQTQGVLVAGILPHSPAAQAGVKAGDLLLSATIGENAQNFDVAFAEALPPVNGILAAWPVGQKVELELLREGKTERLNLTPTPRPRAVADEREIAGWDLTLSDITPLMALDYQLPSTRGVWLSGIAEGGAAATAEPALQEGDVLLKLGAKTIANRAEFEAAVAKIGITDEGTPVLVEVWREGERLLSVVRVKAAGNQNDGGEVAKAWLPVSTQVVTQSLSQALKLPANVQGVRITRLLGGASGLQVGDILLALDGAPIEASTPEDSDVFAAMVRQYHIGSSAKVAFWRNGKASTVNVRLGAAPRAERELPTYRDANFGLTVRSISYWDRARGDAEPGQNGVYVAEVTEGGWAAVAGLQTGDLLVQIDGHAVSDLAEAKTALQKLEKTKPSRTVFFVASGVRTRFLEVVTGWN